MSQRYDASSKFFMALSPRDWLVLIGAPVDTQVAELDTDVSTVSARVDKLLYVGGETPHIEHIEIQSGRDQDVPVRVCRYGVLIHYQHRVSIHSTVILLCRAADGPELTGFYLATYADGSPYLQYRYRVIRVWELPAESFLKSGIGVLAFAPLAKIEEEKIPALLAQMRSRVDRELDRSERANFWTGTAVLMGLIFPLTRVDEFLKGIANVDESVIAQMLIDRGREEGREKGREEGREVEARKLILRVITHRFGSVDPQLQAAIEGITNVEILEQLLDLALDANDIEMLSAAIRR